MRRHDRDTQLETRHPVSPLVHNLPFQLTPRLHPRESDRLHFANSRSIRMSVVPGGRPPIRGLDVFQNTAAITIAGVVTGTRPVAKAHFHGVLSISLRLPSALLYAPMRTLGGRGLPKVSGGLRYASVAAMLVLCVAVLSCAGGTD